MKDLSWVQFLICNHT